MTFPERFSDLPEYAFPRLRALLDSIEPGGEVVHMTIGEPKHPFPAWVRDVIADASDDFGRYPPNDGTPELLDAIAGWLRRRFDLDLDCETQIMAANGTRESLFAACLALCPEKADDGEPPVVLTPNPFYQVYAVAAAAAGARAEFIPATRQNGFLPDFANLNPALLDRVAVAYICSPSNPQGAVASQDYWLRLIELAERHDFKIFSDECYSEIYRDQPPTSAMRVAQDVGADEERVVIFNSLSKRSNLPGLRSGFVAGGPECVARIKQLRAYAGAPLPIPLQRAAEKVWSDESHVQENRRLYQEKYLIADEIFAGVQGYQGPQAGFFLWLPVEDGERAAIKLWGDTGVRVLPGAYLGRKVQGENPGEKYVRVAMVASKEELQRGLKKIRDCFYK